MPPPHSLQSLHPLPPLHMGALHGAEGFAVLVLALGPLLVCVATVVFLRWRGERPPG